MKWTKDEVLDQVDFDFMEGLKRDREDWPSTRQLVASYLGHKPPKKPEIGDLSDLIAMFPSGTIG